MRRGSRSPPPTTNLREGESAFFKGVVSGRLAMPQWMATDLVMPSCDPSYSGD